MLSACSSFGMAALHMTGKPPEARRADLDFPPDPFQPDAEKIAETQLALGAEYLRQGQFEKALRHLDKSRIKRPNHAMLHNVYALSYQGLGDNEKAEQHFRQALRIGHGQADVRTNYGQFLCKQQRYAEAETMLLAAVQDPLYESPQLAYVNLGICARAVGDAEQAYDYVQQALSQDEEFSVALLLLGDMELQRGQTEQARQRLRRYLALHPHTAGSAWLGVRIERMAGGDKDALASYALLLRNQFSSSQEAARYRESLQVEGRVW